MAVCIQSGDWQLDLSRIEMEHSDDVPSCVMYEIEKNEC